MSARNLNLLTLSNNAASIKYKGLALFVYRPPCEALLKEELTIRSQSESLPIISDASVLSFKTMLNTHTHTCGLLLYER